MHAALRVHFEANLAIPPSDRKRVPIVSYPRVAQRKGVLDRAYSRDLYWGPHPLSSVPKEEETVAEHINIHSGMKGHPGSQASSPEDRANTVKRLLSAAAETLSSLTRSQLDDVHRSCDQRMSVLSGTTSSITSSPSMLSLQSSNRCSTCTSYGCSAAPTPPNELRDLVSGTSRV